MRVAEQTICQKARPLLLGLRVPFSGSNRLELLHECSLVRVMSSADDGLETRLDSRLSAAVRQIVTILATKPRSSRKMGRSPRERRGARGPRERPSWGLGRSPI